jgi:hypothetical protein
VQEERHIDALPGSMPDRYRWVGGDLLAATIQGERGYVHGDIRASTSAFTNASGERSLA